MLRAASGENERGRMPCRAQAAPAPKFSWSYNGQDLNVNKTWKFNVELKQIDALTYESTLLIEKIGKNDYGKYKCIARNELGTSEELIRLDVTSKPDMPISLNILNATHDSVTIAWTPGFDGGMKASYRVRYRELSSDHYKYEDSLPNSHKLTINGLKSNTPYLFSVSATNALGSSNYLPDLAKAHTKGNYRKDYLDGTERHEITKWKKLKRKIVNKSKKQITTSPCSLPLSSKPLHQSHSNQNLHKTQ